MAAKYSIGDRVIIKAFGNKVGIVDGEPRETRGRLFYPVSIEPSKPSSYYPEDTLQAFVPPKTVELLLKDKQFIDTAAFIQEFIYKKLEKPLADNLYTFYASRTEFLVHQFKPVLKFLKSSKQRLLLADEVGLGKTIEVGIIITEISARLGGLPRILIVCPSMLTQKWEREMQKRFNLNFNILRKTDFDRFLDRYTEYGEAETLKGIISLQALRSSEIIDKLRDVDPRFDIVVVDEAHHMRNPETLSNELGEVLSEKSDAMLFLTATPLQLGTPDLFYLLGLLVPEEFSDFALFHNLIEPNEYINNALRRLYEPHSALEQLKRVEQTSQKDRFVKNSFYHDAIQMLSGSRKLTREQAIRLQKLLIELNCLSYIFTRTKKKDVETEFPIREANVITVKFTQPEIDFYNAVTDFVAERFTARYSTSQGISFAIIMPQRQVASCIQAMKERLAEILKKRIIRGPSDDNGDVIDFTADTGKSWKLEDAEVAALRKLKECAAKLGETDTKYDRFLEALRKLDNEDKESKIIVFAFFKKTLEYLMRRLANTEYRGKVALIHGDIHTKDRQRIIKEFRQPGGIKVLLSSEVGGEGLDFEFCNAMFNYDLPWNPMRVEQRIGRLDRYGQRHEKILIYNFSMLGTIDDEILSRLYARINIFERYIGDLEAILGDQIAELTKDIFNTKLTKEQKIRKIEKAAENIERRQRELEEFEDECQRFIGQDEYFNNEVSRILETKRFITSEEVMFFIRHFLKTFYQKTTLLPPKRGRENVFVLKSDESFRRFIRRYSPPTENIKELEKKLSLEGGILVTFNDQEACRDESIEFITIHHPIVKAIKRYYDDNKQELCATAQFHLTGDSEYLGKYIFFVYLLEKTALKKDLLLIPILVNLESGKVHITDELCDWFLAEIAKAEPVERNIADYNDVSFEKYFKEAGEYLEIIREEEEKKLKRDNDTLINNQIESVKQAAAIKIKKAEEIIRKLKSQGKTEDDSIVRLYRGRIRNFTISAEDKVNLLEQNRFISVGFNLISGGVVEIGN
jgi:superfamily II DNA/RNA helicase